MCDDGRFIGLIELAAAADDGDDDGGEVFLGDMSGMGARCTWILSSTALPSAVFVQISQVVRAAFVVLRKRNEKERRINWGDGCGIRVGLCEESAIVDCC